MKHFLLLVCFSILFLASCKQCETRACQNNESLDVKFVNYSTSQADTFIFRSFQQGSNFNWPVDSGYVHSSSADADTVFLLAVNRTGIPLYMNSNLIDYDIEIENIFDHKIIRISNIQHEQNFVEYCHSPFTKTYKLVECTNKLNTFNYSVSNGSIDAIGNNILIYK